MHKIELIKFDKLNVHAPNAFQTTGMHFVGLRYPSRQLQLYLHGHVEEAAQQGNPEYGGQWSFMFKPSPEDLPNLTKLEELFQPTSSEHERLMEDLEADFSKYEFKETLTDEHLLRIKLRTDPTTGGWKFTSNATITEDSLPADLKKGTPVTLTVAPGFYFSDESEKYGLFFTLKDIKFDEAVDLPMRPKKTPLGNKKILKRAN